VPEYCIKLKCCNTWQLAAPQSREDFLDRMAALMGLFPCGPDDYPKIFFTPFNPNEEDSRELLIDANYRQPVRVPLNGWKPLVFPSITLWQHPEIPDIIAQFQGEVSVEDEYLRMYLALFPVYRQVIATGGINFHSGLIVREGRAVLVAGAGGAGKSTLCRRIPDPWRCLCDDEVLIVLDPSGSYYAHPMPTCSEFRQGFPDKTWDINHGYPISAICFIDQAEKDQAIPMGQGEAAVRINQSAHQTLFSYILLEAVEDAVSLKKKIFENACRMAKTLPAYTLRLTRTGESWKELDKVFNAAATVPASPNCQTNR